MIVLGNRQENNINYLIKIINIGGDKMNKLTYVEPEFEAISFESIVIMCACAHEDDNPHR